MINKKKSKKRLGVFLIFDEKGEVHDYVLYLLDDIIKNLDRLVIVCNGEILEEGIKKLLIYTSDIIVRPNVGFDFAGWKEGLVIYLGFEEVRNYDELVLFNDSIFGPLYPFKEVFEKMEGKADFWGLSFHGETHNVYGLCPYGYRPHYLQTYFLVICNRLLHSEEFEDYWTNLPVQNTFNEVVEKVACVFTKYFEDIGYKWRAYCDTSDLDSNRDKAMSYHTFNLYDMVARRGFPIIKRKTLVTSKRNSLRFGFAGDVSRTIRYIEKNTKYPMKIIYDYMLKKYNLYDLKNSFNWNCVLPSDICVEQVVDKKVAVIAHLFYPELFEYSFSYLKNIPTEYHIYITTSSDEKKNILMNMIEKYNLKNTQVRMVNSRGRDLSAFLVGCKDFILDYDFVCFIHDKRSVQKEFPSIGTQFSDILWESMLQSTDYIRNIVNHLEQNDNLGLLVPLNVYHGSYFASSTNYWTICFDKTLEVAEDLGLEVRIEEDKPPVSVGTVFWCKTDALKTLITKDWNYEDFLGEPLPNDGSISHALERIIPYVAQHNGYYTETIMSPDIASVEISNLRLMWTETINALKGFVGLSFYNHFKLIDSINNAKRTNINLLPIQKKIVTVKEKEIIKVPVKEIVLVEIGAKRAIANYIKKKLHLKEKKTC